LEQNILEHEVIRLRSENQDLRRQLAENPSFDFVGLIENLHQKQMNLLESHGSNNQQHLRWLEGELRKEKQNKEQIQIEMLDLKQRMIKLQSKVEDDEMKHKEELDLISKLEEMHTRQLQTALHLTSTNTPLSLIYQSTQSEVLTLNDDVWVSDEDDSKNNKNKSHEKQTNTRENDAAIAPTTMSKSLKREKSKEKTTEKQKEKDMEGSDSDEVAEITSKKGSKQSSNSTGTEKKNTKSKNKTETIKQNSTPNLTTNSETRSKKKDKTNQ
jgi:hypothetical protein